MWFVLRLAFWLKSCHHSAANHFIATEIRVSGGGNRCLGRGNRVNL